VSAVLSEAVEDWLIPANPVSGLWRTLSKGKHARSDKGKKVRALDAAQAGAFRRAARETEPRTFPYLMTLMLAGLRPGEGLAVTKDRLDLTNGKLLVDRQIAQPGGVKVTKTGDERTVDLSADLVNILKTVMTASEAGGAKVVSITGEAVPGTGETDR
jgi:integrase